MESAPSDGEEEAGDDFVINEEKFSVRARDGRKYVFRPRSKLLFALLARVARHRGHHVWFDQLRSGGDVWGQSRVEDSTVRSAVARLRAELRAAGFGDLAGALKTGNYKQRCYVVLDPDQLDGTRN
jgi:DNA-binding winged helix-turn-helix (wHTH) protein